MKRFTLAVILVFLTHLLITLVVFPAAAQNNLEAGLFTEAKQLPVISHGMDILVYEGEALITIEQVFRNDGPDVGQADYRLHLPKDATVTEFGFWNRGKYFEASLKSKEEAKEAHTKAASEGRATGILHKDSDMQHFSVFPLMADEQKRVRLAFSMPVVTELGRHHLRVPVDSFLGQDAVLGSATATVSGKRKIEQFGVEGVEDVFSTGKAHSITWHMSVNRSFELWWKEKPVPLVMTGGAVKLDDDQYAVELRVAMDSVAPGENTPEKTTVFLDGSFSMRQKLVDVKQFLTRVAQNGAFVLHVVTEKSSDVSKQPILEVMTKIESGAFGHRLDWAKLRTVLKTAHCTSALNRCIVVTDLSSLTEQKGSDGEQLPAKVVWFADAHEKAYFEDTLEEKTVHVVDVDAKGNLQRMADELMLPVLRVNRITSTNELRTLSQQRMQLAQGGRLSVYGDASDRSEMDVQYNVDERPEQHQRVKTEEVSADSPEGKRIRKGYFRVLLAEMMETYRKEPSEELKGQVVEISLREDIPTAFTSLQVDDPALSLFSMKPGDPIITVYNEPGVVDVIAVYPFGDVKKLVFNKTDDTYTDRFLVPRGWRDQSYKIAVYKKFKDETVKKEYAFYQIDRKGPEASISYEPSTDLLAIVPENGSRGIGAVQVHLADKTVFEVTPIKGKYLLYAKDMTEQSYILIRDRAGNMSRFTCQKEEDDLSCKIEISKKDAAAPGASGKIVSLRATGKGLQVTGDVVTASWYDEKISFSLKESKLNSLQLRSFAKDTNGTYWLGTALGDVVKVTCKKNDVCTATPLKTDFYGHAVMGIVAQEKEPLRVAVLGKGLFAWKDGRFERMKVRAKSRYVTGLTFLNGTLYYSTLRNGLFKIVNGTGRKIGLPVDLIWNMNELSGKLMLDTPKGRFVQKKGDVFRNIGTDIPVASGSLDVTSAVQFAGKTIVGAFDDGLKWYNNGMLNSIDMKLSPMQRRINALAVFKGKLYMGTEAGLLTTTDLRLVQKTTIVDAVHDLAVSEDGVAVASAGGLYLVNSKGEKRLDGQLVGKGRFSTVAFWNSRVVAGNINGLFWFDGKRAGQYGIAQQFTANFVTALTVKDGVLYVGTYDQGVFQSNGDTFKRVRSLKKQWVPPHGLQWINKELWVGGMGMSPKHGIPGKPFEAVHVPVRDVNDFYQTENGTLLLTSDGLVEIPN